MSASSSRLLVSSNPTGLTVSSADDRIVLEAIGASVDWASADDRGTWRPDRWLGGDADRVALNGPHGLELRVSVALLDGGEAVDLSLEVHNRGNDEIRIERLTVIDCRRPAIGLDGRRWSMYRNGHQSWSGTRTYRVDERDADMPTAFLATSSTDSVHRAPQDVGHFRSDTWSAISEQRSGDALGIGFVTTADAFSYVELDVGSGAHGELTAWCDLDGTPLPAGESLTSERLCLVASRGPGAANHALADIFDRCGREMSARLDGGRRGGWCSWYYYFQNVTEDDVDANLAVLEADGAQGPRFASSYVMVDDGHQKAIGDWLDTAPAFPSGMKSVAGKIRDAGFDAGLWWAPFICGADSTVATDHPEWLLRNDRGRPVVPLVNPAWGVRLMRSLDTTHPEVQDHLAQVARTMVSEWGYELLKLDFLYAASMKGVRHGGGTRAAALRAGLDAVRRGAGDDAFLLGCGCPLGPAVGVVDAMRIGADVSPIWEMPTARVQRRLHGISTRHAIRNVLTRYSMDGRLWDNDPDCLMVRATDTKLTLDEVRLLATVIGMTNGMIVVSDALADLAEDRVAIIGATVDLQGGAVEVIDLFDTDIPETIVSRHEHHVDVALLNPHDRARSAAVDLEAIGLSLDRIVDAVDFWTGRPVTIEHGVVRVRSAPRHSATVIRLGVEGAGHLNSHLGREADLDPAIGASR